MISLPFEYLVLRLYRIWVKNPLISIFSVYLEYSITASISESNETKNKLTKDNEETVKNKRDF